MKKAKLLTWILTVALIVAVGASLVACVDKPGPTQPQELKIPSLAADQMAVIIKNGEGDYTYYTVTLTDEMHTGEDVVNYLVAEQQLTVKWNDSDYGKYITEIGSLKPDEAKGEFVSILTSVEDDQGTWAGVTTYEADGVTLASAAVGISEMSVMAGAVIYFEVDTY